MESFQWIERADINEEKWCACVASNPFTASVFAEPWYLDVCATPWSALVYGDYLAVMPVFWKKKYGLHYVYPPFFVSQIGILGDVSNAPEPEAWLRAIPRRFKYIELIFNSENHISSTKLKCITNHSYVLDCRQSYEMLRKGYHNNHKYNLNKADRQLFEVKHEVDPEQVIRLFRQQWEGNRSVGFKEHDYLRLQRILKQLQVHQALESWAVVDVQGNLHAAAFFPFMYGRYTFLFSGRSEASRENRAMFYLVDCFVRQHAGSECLLNFDTNNPQIARFYKGFGAECQSYSQVLLPFYKRCII